jgi:hypothetical protein
MIQEDPDETSSANFEVFRDCLSTALVERVAKQQTKSTSKGRRKAGASKSPGNNTSDQAGVAGSGINNDAEELAEFIEYIASEAYPSVPSDLQTLDHYIWAENKAIKERYSLPLTGEGVSLMLPALDPSVSDSLVAYGIIDDVTQTVNEFLAPILTEYITTVSTAPPPPRTTRTEACEICGRDWINLSYHHLIPRFVHDKVVKRGWHRPEELQNVAWLCGACHRFVHRFANHEDLARHYYTVELLMEQEEIINWANWVGKLRWKSGKTWRRR